jgi:hypothetical protein
MVFNILKDYKRKKRRAGGENAGRNKTIYYTVWPLTEKVCDTHFIAF